MIWLSTGFAFLTLYFSAFLYRVSPLLALELAAGVTLAMLHPVNALCLFIHLLFLRPWEIVSDNRLLLALPRAMILLCAFSWMIHPEHRGKPTRATLHVSTLLAGFSLWLFLSTFQTPHVIQTQARWFDTYFKSLVVFVMCLYFIENEKSVVEFKLTLAISVLALMVVGFHQYIATTQTLSRLQSVGLFEDPNDVASMIVMAIPFILVPLFDRRTGLLRQTIGLLYSGFALLMIWYTKSRGAMMAVLMQAFTFRFLKSSRGKRLRFLLLGSLLCVGYFLAVKTIPRTAEDMDASQGSRLTFWRAAVSMTLHNPVWGVGFDQYPTQYLSYASGSIFEWGKRTAHSSWLLAFAESGVLGGFLFAAFFLAVLQTAWRNRERWADHLISLVGYGTAMTFLSHTYTVYIYLLAGLILASDSLREQPNV